MTFQTAQKFSSVKIKSKRSWKENNVNSGESALHFTIRNLLRIYI